MKTRIGSLVTELREKLGYSKARLAREADISHGYLSQIEKGERVPSSKVLRRLASVLGVPSYELEKAAGLVSETDVEYLLSSLEQALERDEGGKRAKTVKRTSRATPPLPDKLTELLFRLMPEMAGARASVAGPEGWSELSPRDRRLVQQLIKRLRGEQDGAKKRGKK